MSKLFVGKVYGVTKVTYKSSINNKTVVREVREFQFVYFSVLNNTQFIRKQNGSRLQFLS